MAGIEIHNYDSGTSPSGQTWNTTELQQDFEVTGFAAPFVVVRRRSDGVKGTLEFSHSPRIYWGFSPSN